MKNPAATLGLFIEDLPRTSYVFTDLRSSAILFLCQDQPVLISLAFYSTLLSAVWTPVTSSSALVWAQDQSAPDNSPNQFTGEKARDNFYKALTTGAEQSYADTSLDLGHLMHQQWPANIFHH